MMVLWKRVSSTENDINIRLAKAWIATDGLSIIWKSGLSDSGHVNSTHGCTIWTLVKRTEKKPEAKCPRMLRIILSKSWNQHPTKEQLYGHQPSISKTIQIRRTRHAWQCWINKNELISDALLGTSPHRRASVGRPIRTYLHQLCTDTGCRLETCRK